MTREQLKAWLQEQMRTGEEEFDAIWSWLEDNRWLAEFDQADPGLADEHELLAEARRLAEFLYGVRSSREGTVRYAPPARLVRGVPEEVSVDLGDYTRKRAETTAEVGAFFADEHPNVREFRKKHLGGEDTRLTKAQASEFLEGSQTTDALDDLMRLGRILGWRYRWTYRDTWWFVLTGDAPRVEPLRVHYDYVKDEPHYPNMAQLTLIIEPWVDAAEVERVYREVQRQILGGDSRKKDERTLEAVRFVAHQKRRSNATWTELLRRWNGAQSDPERCYKGRNGLFQAFRRFVRAYYQRPAIKDSQARR